MKMKNWLPKLTIVAMLGLTFLFTTPVFADESHETSEPVVIRTIAATVEDEDADWPIIQVERHEKRDPITGEMHVNTIIIRESPPTYSPSIERLLGCNEDSDDQVQSHFNTDTAVLSSCTWVSAQSIENNDVIGSITSHAKHFADRYCQSGDCIYYKPYKFQAWWTRTNSNWSASNATVNWGCGACVDCAGGTTAPVYTDGPYTPTWQNSSQSHYYVYTSSTFPVMHDTFYAKVNGIVDSDAYENSTYKGQMKVQTAF